MIDWRAKPKQEDYAAAQTYLSLVMDAALAGKYVKKLSKGSRSFVQGQGYFPSLGATALADGQFSCREGSAEDRRRKGAFTAVAGSR